MVDLEIVWTILSPLFSTGSISAFTIIHLNLVIGLLVSSYIKKSRGVDLGLGKLGLMKRYTTYHVLALLFYSISLLAALTGKKFDEVF